MRIYFEYSTQELRALFEKSKSDNSEFATILDELKYRSNSLAKKLEEDIKQWIVDSNIRKDVLRNNDNTTINLDLSELKNLSKIERRSLIAAHLSKSILGNDVYAIAEFFNQGEINRRDVYEIIDKEVIKKLFFILRPDLLISREETQNFPSWLKYENEYAELLLGVSQSVITDIIIQRQIQKLLHFTRVENLPSILANGIVPKSKHAQLGIKCDYNDEKRLDHETDFTSLSISFPNDHLLCAYYYKTNVTSWAIIEIDPRILISKRKRYYCKQNAAHEMNRWSSKKSMLSLPLALEEMFEEVHIYRNQQFLRKELSLPDYYTTNPQAEILIEGTIEYESILKIILKGPQDLEYLKSVCDQKTLRRFEFECSNSCYFMKRHDYDVWPTGTRYRESC